MYHSQIEKCLSKHLLHQMLHFLCWSYSLLFPVKITGLDIIIGGLSVFSVLFLSFRHSFRFTGNTNKKFIRVTNIPHHRSTYQVFFFYFYDKKLSSVPCCSLMFWGGCDYDFTIVLVVYKLDGNEVFI